MQFSLTGEYGWTHDGHSNTKHSRIDKQFEASRTDVAIEIAEAFLQQYLREHGALLEYCTAKLKFGGTVIRQFQLIHQFIQQIPREKPARS